MVVDKPVQPACLACDGLTDIPDAYGKCNCENGLFWDGTNCVQSNLCPCVENYIRYYSLSLSLFPTRLELDYLMYSNVYCLAIPLAPNSKTRTVKSVFVFWVAIAVASPRNVLPVIIKICVL